MGSIGAYQASSDDSAIKGALVIGIELIKHSKTLHISPFGRDTIRRFSNDAVEMKRLGARDFEDLLLKLQVRTFGKWQISVLR